MEAISILVIIAVFMFFMRQMQGGGGGRGGPLAFEDKAALAKIKKTTTADVAGVMAKKTEELVDFLREPEVPETGGQIGAEP